MSATLETKTNYQGTEFRYSSLKAKRFHVMLGDSKTTILQKIEKLFKRFQKSFGLKQSTNKKI